MAYRMGVSLDGENVVVFYDMKSGLIIALGLGLWGLTLLSTFISGGNQNTWRKPQTCHKSLTKFII